MYDKVTTNLDFVKREREILAFWKENDIFKKSIAIRKDAPVFTFYDGPPTANGKPHIGHILSRVVKDVIPRYRTMKGYKVLRKAGWDTHGLPVELEVEKQLNISGKPQIEEYGVEPFIQQCKESVWTYETWWREMSDRVGFWADMDEPYVTYHNNYIESVWWALKTIWDKGLLYKGHKIVPYCPRCGTALSSHEVAQGYKDVKETSVFVKFKVKDRENEYLLAWTTTPWTLPSNVALVVNAHEEYARIRTNGEVYIIASALASTVLTGAFEIIEECKGETLQNMEYEPLFDFPVQGDKKGFVVVCDDYVTLTDGTGIVHTAPAFGEDDARIGRLYDLPFVQFVDEQGRFVPAVKPWAGLFVKEADPKIIAWLKNTGQLYKAEDYEHNYPFCWRCDTPLLYYARNTWFIQMTKLRDRLVANNETVNWLPDNVKQGRFGNFLENVIDWGLSRERYWGTPLPIWECKCGHFHAIGSIAELREMSGNVPADIELHKPYIDQVTLNCPECGGQMTRVPEVIDCWFDSGSMPFAQIHYPFENQELFEENFPADFISEAIDQTRGWFYTLMAISTLLFDKSPYKNVIVLGHVQDKDGQKMSKHKGNGIDPFDILDKYGADAIRWYFCAGSASWLPKRFYEDAVAEVQRKFMGTLWNTYAFYILYAEIDQFDPTQYSLDYDKLQPMDRWILSKLNTLIRFVDENLENYRLTEPSRALNEFVDALSNWYIRRNRQRFWASGMPQDKINAYMTLYTVLSAVTKLSAVFVPFLAEMIYQNLVKKVDKNAPASVHLNDYPAVCESWSDPKLESDMDFVLRVVVAGRAARNAANIKNRQPIGNMYVESDIKLADETYADIIREELNVKTLTYEDDLTAFTTYQFKPQLKTLGPKYGKLVPQIGATLANHPDGNTLMRELQTNGHIRLLIGEMSVELAEADLLIETVQRIGFVSESDQGITVVIDTNLTEDLIEEGFVRELISKLQTMRKEAGFEVLDRIHVYYSGSDRIAGTFARNAGQIQTDVLADTIAAGKGPDGCYQKQWYVNGEPVLLAVTRV